MLQFNILIVLLMVIQGFAKDIHYTAKGPSFYAKHIFADLVEEDIDGFIDDIKENVFLGTGIVPLASKEYFRIAALTAPEVMPLDIINFTILKAFVDKVREIIKGIEAPTRGANSLLDSIGEHMDKMSGLIFRQLTQGALNEAENFKKEDCEGCAQRAVDRAKVEMAKIDYDKVAATVAGYSNQCAAMCEDNEEDPLEKLSKKLGL